MVCHGCNNGLPWNGGGVTCTNPNHLELRSQHSNQNDIGVMATVKQYLQPENSVYSIGKGVNVMELYNGSHPEQPDIGTAKRVCLHPPLRCPLFQHNNGILPPSRMRIVEEARSMGILPLIPTIPSAIPKCTENWLEVDCYWSFIVNSRKQT